MPSRTGDMGRRDGFVSLVEAEFLTRSQKLMEADLAKSDLEDNDIFCTPLAHPPVPMTNPQWVLGAYRIPYWNREGNTMEGMYRDRLFYRTGITERQLKEAHMSKYKGPSAEQAGLSGADARMPYLLPGGTGTTGIICEGEKKAASALNRFGTPVLGIGGCWNWSDGSESRIIHPDIRWWCEGKETILIIADPDIRTNRQIAQGYSGLRRRVASAFPRAAVRVIALEGKVDDFLAVDEKYSLEDLKAEPEVDGLDLAISLSDMVAEFDLVVRTTQQGLVSIYKNAYNTHALLTLHPFWKGSLKYNLDSAMYELYGQPFKEGDNDHQITQTFNKQLHMPDLGIRMVKDAIRAVCLENSYSPAQIDIEDCPTWDGEPRLQFIFGEERTIQEIEISKAFVVGYVKRVLFPGCDWRSMVILVGPQGVGKTGMAKWLAGDENRVSVFEHGELERADKDVLIRLMRAKIALFDDVDTFDHRERGKLKRLVTQTHTHQREAYHEKEAYFARSGIMMGTSNHKEIVPDDPTGNTRFLVIEIKEKQDFEWLNEHRRQIIAEALVLVKSGWSPSIDFATMKQYVEEGGIHTKVTEFIDDLRTGKFKTFAIEGKSGRRYFKSEVFWTYYGGSGYPYRPKDWERKELTQRLRAAGLDTGVMPDSSVERTKDGATIKNVWRWPT